MTIPCLVDVSAPNGACFDSHDGHPTPCIDQRHHPGQIHETSADKGGHVEALNIRIFLWTFFLVLNVVGWEWDGMVYDNYFRIIKNHPIPIYICIVRNIGKGMEWSIIKTITNDLIPPIPYV